jgi:hypothetical protein
VDFDCGHNNLTTLEGAPISVEGDFYCNSNRLNTLEGAPISVGGDFYCHKNNLYTLEGAPRSVGIDFYCWGNEFDIIRIMFPDSKKFLEASNYWDFFAGGNRIYRHRLKEALADHNKALPKSIPGYEYT